MNASDPSVTDVIGALINRGRAAQRLFEQGATQERYDLAATAVGWALLDPTRNKELSEMAVANTGLGNVADKITKNHRKTLGLLRDVKGKKTCGVLAQDTKIGLTEIARPIGVIAAIVPSTNPVATPVNNTINALKCGNAIILAPSPKGVRVCEKLVGYIHAELRKLDLPVDLVQLLPAPAAKDKTQALMEMADLLVVTGSQDNVRRAYSSGTPCIGVGAGNATVIVDETADLAAAADKIAASKSFDNATSCSSENALVVVDAIYDAFVAELTRAGGRMLSAPDQNTLKSTLFQGGHLNRQIIARDVTQVIDVTGVHVDAPTTARFLILPAEGIGADHPESGEKLSLVISLYRAADYEGAVATAERILQHQGAGHSIGLHSTDADRPVTLGLKLPVCRVIVNQAHTFATGGSFENGLPFSLSMGCGSWGGNSIDENLNYTHFMNTTKVVRPIPANEPGLPDIFQTYWDAVGA
ncbi:aldehyde dehydrogenase family protein [Roseobacter sp.]|uniref:acylating sulfoacetaldehyde dehydrogenase n=1 Tax=Roseobacter sp. TaxID=1907202 RepID=UPI00329A3BA7